MVTEGEPTDLVKVLHLLVLSFTWGMQVWVSFIAGMRLTNAAAGLRHYTKNLNDLNVNKCNIQMTEGAVFEKLKCVTKQPYIEVLYKCCSPDVR